MKDGGFLAIWSDVAPADETDYLHWLTREHIAERLGVPGFLSARVYRAQTDAPRYMILYWLEDATVLSSAPYLARLNNPTPWSQRIMPKWSRFTRGGGFIRFRSRPTAGGLVAPLVDPGPMQIGRLHEVAAKDGLASVSFLETDRVGSDIKTTEKGLRDSNHSFDTLLLIEALSERFLADALRSIASDNCTENDVYDLIFSQLAGSHPA